MCIRDRHNDNDLKKEERRNNAKETSENYIMYKINKSEKEISEEKKKDIQTKHKNKGRKLKYNKLT